MSIQWPIDLQLGENNFHSFRFSCNKDFNLILKFVMQSESVTPILLYSFCHSNKTFVFNYHIKVIIYNKSI